MKNLKPTLRKRTLSNGNVKILFGPLQLTRSDLKLEKHTSDDRAASSSAGKYMSKQS